MSNNNTISKKAGAGLVYFISSSSTVFLNKIISTNIQMHMALVAVQSGVIAVALLFVGIPKVRSIEYKDLKRWIPVSLMLALVTGSNMKTVYYFPVTLVTLYKNASIILIAIAERCFFKSNIRPLQYVGLVIITLSTYTGKITDTTALKGYIWMIFNIVVSAGYVLLFRHSCSQYIEEKNRSKSAISLESAFFTNLLLVPAMCLFSALTDTYNISEIRLNGMLLLLASSITALLTSISTAWSLQIYDATTLCMLGAVSKILLGLLGIVFLKEPAETIRIVSLVAGIFGGILYTLAISEEPHTATPEEEP